MIRIHPNLLTAIGLIMLVYLALPQSVLHEPVVPQPAAPAPASLATQAPAAPPPANLRQLFATATQGDTGPNPTQQAIEQEQIQEALSLTRSADPGERRVGIEQLSAYPSVAGEKALMNGITDRDAGVREAAWNSLGQLPSPSDSVVRTLLDKARTGATLQRTAALDTLSAYLDSASLAPGIRQRILKGFKQQFRDRTLSESQRDILRDALGQE